jgi:hypothetical protein
VSETFNKVAKHFGVPASKSEYGFALPERKWKFDYAWPEHLVALECEGGVWVGGRHTSGSGFLKDIEKYNAAAVRGWLVLRCTPATLFAEATFKMINLAIALRKAA